MTLVIAGLPNAGKSSLMNALTGQDSAIVTATPGTTRDVLREQIEIDGLPRTSSTRPDFGSPLTKLNARACAGRASNWPVQTMPCGYSTATDPDAAGLAVAGLPEGLAVTRVRNKTDLTAHPPGLRNSPMVQRSGSLQRQALVSRRFAAT